jgi:acyl-CoA thioesterase-1
MNLALDFGSVQRFGLRRLGLACVLFAALSASGAASASEQSAARVIVVLGDSLAAGHGLTPAEAYPAVLQRKIATNGLHFTVLDAGISGDTTAGGLRRLDWVLQRRVDVLIIALGGNDGLRGIQPDVTRSNLQSMIDRSRQKYPEIEIVLAGMRMPPNLGKEYLDRFQAVYPDLAKTNRVSLIPFLLEGVGGRADKNQEDLIHPTAEGHELIASNVWKILEPILRRLAREGSKP